jgi:hypothetical protein
MARTGNLQIENFAQIDKVNLAFGDLTVLVGAQGTGKSLALQWFKASVDGKQVVAALKDSGQFFEKPDALVDLIFGVGMGSSWRAGSKVLWNDVDVKPANIGRLGRLKERVFFIPAHRSMLISDGWASPFQRLSTDIPVVARLFSQNLFNRFSARSASDLFPLHRVLKKEYRDLIDEAVFHGGTVGIDQDQQHSKRLKLTHGETRLPYMTWTAGQREFTPLLLGLYDLLPPRKEKKKTDIDWVVIEEPEMGLHPQAISVFLLLTLDLLWRGYKVVLSTHSPHILAAIWMLRVLANINADWKHVCDAFGVPKSAAMKDVAESALQKDYRVNLLEFNSSNVVESKDISTLDPSSEDDDVSGWGGLTGFTSKFSEIVRRAVLESENNAQSHKSIQRPRGKSKKVRENLEKGSGEDNAGSGGSAG